MALTLFELADKIAALRTCVETQRQDIEAITAKIDAIELQVDTAIAFDPDLKNEAQRKVHRIAALADDQAWGLLQTSLKTHQRELRSLEIDVELYRHRFTALKLTEQRAIAEMQQAA
jgi:hypothetical protein